MMKKEKYERTELEIINFMTGVVLITIYSEAKYKTIKETSRISVSVDAFVCLAVEHNIEFPEKYAILRYETGKRRRDDQFG